MLKQWPPSSEGVAARARCDFPQPIDKFDLVRAGRRSVSCGGTFRTASAKGLSPQSAVRLVRLRLTLGGGERLTSTSWPKRPIACSLSSALSAPHWRLDSFCYCAPSWSRAASAASCFRLCSQRVKKLRARWNFCCCRGCCCCYLSDYVNKKRLEELFRSLPRPSS